MFFFLPYGTDRQTARFPIVTCFLIGLNVAVYLSILPLDRQAALMEFGLVPAHPSMRDLVTAMFVHANVLHLASNMLYLWLFGPNVEDALGRLEYAILYVGSGFAAALLNLGVVYSLIPVAVDKPTVGASGCIAGVLGIYAVRFYWTKISVFWYVGILFYPLRWGTFGISAVIGLAIWFTQQLLGGLISLADPLGVRVSYWSHIGGMLFGMLLAYALRLGPEGRKEYLMADGAKSIERGRLLQAAGDFRALLAYEPRNPHLHGELAKIYALQQDPEHAIPHYEECVRLFLAAGSKEAALDRFAELKHFYRNARLPLPIEYAIAVCLAEAGRYTSAIEMFSSICSAHPDSPETETALMRIGDIYLRKLEDAKTAVRSYERFLGKYPHSEWRGAVVKSLAEARARLSD